MLTFVFWTNETGLRELVAIHGWWHNSWIVILFTGSICNIDLISILLLSDNQCGSSYLPLWNDDDLTLVCYLDDNHVWQSRTYKYLSVQILHVIVVEGQKSTQQSVKENSHAPDVYLRACQQDPMLDIALQWCVLNTTYPDTSFPLWVQARHM